MNDKSIIQADYIWLGLVVLVECKFFYMIKLPGTLGAVTNSLLVVAASIFTYLIYVIKTKNISNRKYIFSSYLLIVAILLLLEFAYTVIRYPEEKFSETLKEIIPFLTFYSYFLMTYMLRKKYMRTVKYLISFASITAVMMIFQAFLYNNFGISFLKIYSFNYGESAIVFRTMGVRIIGTTFIEYMAYISIGMCFFYGTSKKDKRIYIFNIVVSMIFLLYVSQTRSAIAMLLICILFFMILLYNRSRISKAIIALLVILLINIFSSQIIDLVNSFGKEWSFVHRVDSIKYYIECFAKSPIWGNGLLCDNPDSEINYMIVHGNGRFGYTYSDVGIFGHIAHFGTIGIIMYYLYFKKCFKSIRVNKERNPICIAIVIASLLSLINLSLMDAGRIFEMTVYMAVVDGSVYYMKNNYIKGKIEIR